MEMAMKSLPLYPGARQCVRSGFCCKQGPCPFGTYDEVAKQCIHLKKDKDGRYECGIYEQIVGSPGWEFAPAFGAGCCSPFNEDRQRIIKEAIDRANGTVPGTTK